MLRRDRQLRTQIYQLKDAGLFALGLWLAHLVRYHAPAVLLWWTFDPIDTFDKFVWLYLIIIPGVPLVLESQGFYQRPLFASRGETAWALFKGCLLVTVSVILVMFLFRRNLARGVIVLFGAVSFGLVFLNEELLRLAYKSRFGELQLKKRVILIGAKADILRLWEDLRNNRHDGLEILAEFDLNERSVDELVKLLHETSANSVIINAKHTFFGQVEKAIHACEIEGVEAWLVADFFKTHVSQTSLDDFYGRPVLVFRSAPEASWQGVFKQLLDLALAFVLLLILTLPWLFVAVAIKLTSPAPSS